MKPTLINGYTDQRLKYATEKQWDARRTDDAVLTGVKKCCKHGYNYVFGSHYTFGMGRQKDFVQPKGMAWLCDCGWEMAEDAPKCERCGCTDRPEYR